MRPAAFGRHRFGRWLNSLRSPVQIVIRAQRVDLSGMAARVREAAPALPHPALEAAALDHAGFLGQLAAGQDLLARQVLIAVREPSGGAAAAWGLGALRLTGTLTDYAWTFSIGICRLWRCCYSLTAARWDRAGAVSSPPLSSLAACSC
jgi:hypothetical protein